MYCQLPGAVYPFTGLRQRRFCKPEPCEGVVDVLVILLEPSDRCPEPRGRLEPNRIVRRVLYARAGRNLAVFIVEAPQGLAQMMVQALTHKLVRNPHSPSPFLTSNETHAVDCFSASSIALTTLAAAVAC